MDNRLQVKGPRDGTWSTSALYGSTNEGSGILNHELYVGLFEHYKANGLSSTAALVILARRIARTAWSIYTYKTEFDPVRLIKSFT